jgi:hypothetical protein
LLSPRPTSSESLLEFPWEFPSEALVEAPPLEELEDPMEAPKTTRKGIKKS